MKKIIVIIFILFTWTSSALGAEVTLFTPAQVEEGEIFEVAVLLDTSGEAINTAEVVLNFDPTKAQFAGYKEDGGVIKMWVEPPSATDSIVSFAGFIPGGVTSMYDAQSGGAKPIALAKLLFKARNSEALGFSVAKVSILKNDGQGSSLETMVDTTTKQIVVTPSQSKPLEETIPPENLQIDIIESSLFSKTPQIISFKAEDKETGIDKYMVQGPGGSWQEVQSPYAVRSGLFDRTIVIRAYDYAGNFVENSIVVPGSIPLRIITFGFIALCLVLFYARKLVK